MPIPINTTVLSDTTPTLFFSLSLSLSPSLLLPPTPQSPSVYSSYRRRALEFTFSCLSETLGHRAAETEPLFLYGDFNFRLDFAAVVKVSLLAVHILC